MTAIQPVASVLWTGHHGTPQVAAGRRDLRGPQRVPDLARAHGWWAVPHGAPATTKMVCAASNRRPAGPSGRRASRSISCTRSRRGRTAGRPCRRG